MAYLTTKQFKLDKSSGRGWRTNGVNLSPATEASQALGRPLPTSCAMAGTCATLGCLARAGMNQMPTHLAKRAERTAAWWEDRPAFLAALYAEIERERASAERAGERYAIRPNLLSDLPQLAHAIAKRFPGVQVYDYTKLPKPWLRTRANYHLTYSVSERTTAADVAGCKAHGINMAVVFNVGPGEPLPTRYTLHGHTFRVIDGDQDDLRFLDRRGVIVGLRWKGGKATRAQGVAGGFIRLVEVA